MSCDLVKILQDCSGSKTLLASWVMAVGTGGGESLGEENVPRFHKSEVKPGVACRIKLGAKLGHTLVACNSTWGTGAVVSFSWACHG